MWTPNQIWKRHWLPMTCTTWSWRYRSSPSSSPPFEKGHNQIVFQVYAGFNGQLKAKISSMLEQRNLIGLSHLLAQNAAQLDSEIIYDRDFEYDYFGFKTLERSYLLKVNGRVVERPQHLLMRVAVGIHKANIEGVLKTYHTMSQRWFTHGSPTLFNAGTPRPQVRCFTLISYPNMSLFWMWDCS